MWRPRRGAVLSIAGAWLVASCSTSHTSCTSPIECGAGSTCDMASSTCVPLGTDTGPTTPLDAGEPPDAWTPPPVFDGALDLLLMIDGSNSMAEEQQSFVVEIPRMVTALVTGDHDANGTPEFAPVRSLHIGIVDADMGLGDVTGLMGCDPGFGDDGLMQIRARYPGSGCLADYASTYAGTPNVFAFDVGGASTPAQLASDVSCVAAIGTLGCGIEFELESPLKALSLVPNANGDSPVPWTHPGYRPPSFYAGTFGHGNDTATNGAFLRPDSVLAIVTLNDEDDCSSPNPHIFSLDDPTYNGVDLGLRCHVFADQLYPITRYADGFLGLRARSSQLVYAAITGVPPSVAGMSPEVILADPLMTEQVDPAQQSRLLPSCVSPGGRGLALPAVRMTQLAQLLNAAGAVTTVQSICAESYAPAVDAVLAAIGRGIGGP